jgi:hypothetical protein
MAAQNFGEFALKLSPREVQEELLAPFKKLAADEQVTSLSSPSPVLSLSCPLPHLHRTP